MRICKDLMVSLKTVSPEGLQTFLLELKKACKNSTVEIAEQSIGASPLVKSYIFGKDENILKNARSTRYCIETALWIAKSVMRFEYVYDDKNHMLIMFNLPEEVQGRFYCTVPLSYANRNDEIFRKLDGFAAFEKIHAKYVLMDGIVPFAQKEFHHQYPTKEDVLKNISTIRKWLAYEEFLVLIEEVIKMDNRLCFCPITAKEVSDIKSHGKNAISILINKGIRVIERSIQERERKKNNVK